MNVGAHTHKMGIGLIGMTVQNWGINGRLFYPLHPYIAVTLHNKWGGDLNNWVLCESGSRESAPVVIFLQDVCMCVFTLPSSCPHFQHNRTTVKPICWFSDTVLLLKITNRYVSFIYLWNDDYGAVWSITQHPFNVWMISIASEKPFS